MAGRVPMPGTTTVGVSRTGVAPAAPSPTGPGGHPKMQIVAEGGVTVVVPYAPREGTLDGVAAAYDEVPRGGREPLLLASGGTLRTYTFELIFGYRDPNQSIEDELRAMRDLAESGKRMTVKLDLTTGERQWRMTGFSQQTVGRQFGTNASTRAVCSVTLTEASDPVVGAGPVSGGSTSKTKDKDRPKFVVVKKGDTLQSIAKKYYGNASAWQKIADENKIRDPKKVDVGDKLRLP